MEARRVEKIFVEAALESVCAIWMNVIQIDRDIYLEYVG